MDAQPLLFAKPEDRLSPVEADLICIKAAGPPRTVLKPKPERLLLLKVICGLKTWEKLIEKVFFCSIMYL